MRARHLRNITGVCIRTSNTTTGMVAVRADGISAIALGDGKASMATTITKAPIIIGDGSTIAMTTERAVPIIPTAP